MFKNEKVIYDIIPAKEVRQIANTLEKYTKTKMGDTYRSKNQLNIHNKLHLIGYYVQEIFPTEKEKDKYLTKFLLL